jgi:hypothetical protein
MKYSTRFRTGYLSIAIYQLVDIDVLRKKKMVPIDQSDQLTNGAQQSVHEMYRDSHVKRLAYRMTGNKGKFEAKAEKEEREYHEALQARVQAGKKTRNAHRHHKRSASVKSRVRTR